MFYVTMWLTVDKNKCGIPSLKNKLYCWATGVKVMASLCWLSFNWRNFEILMTIINVIVRETVAALLRRNHHQYHN